MAEINRIKDQLERALKGPAWHGPSILEVLSDVNHSLAASVPMEGTHSIWEILLHIIAWIKIGRIRINGEMTPEQIDPQIDWPPIESVNEEAWLRVKDQLQEEYSKLMNDISRLTVSDLLKQVPGKNYDNYFLLHGIIQHNLYHAGQIAILRSYLLK
jgi:uncharacterized damage-inducible protein DinB